MARLSIRSIKGGTTNLNVSKDQYTTYYVGYGTTTSDSFDGLTRNTAFATIQHAIDEAESGAKIYIADGIYPETLEVNKEHLKLMGETRDGTIIQPATAVDVVDVTADHCYFETIKIVFPTGIGATSAITFDAFKTSLKNVWLHNTGNDGFGFVMSMGNDEQLIEDCYVTGFMNQMNIAGGNRHIIKNNVLALNGAGGINIYIDSTTECKIFENECDGGGAGTGIDSSGNTDNAYFHNNIHNHGAGDNALEDSADNHWWSNYYDDAAPDIDHDGYSDSPYDVGTPAGTDYDYAPIPKFNGWYGLESGAGGGGGGAAAFGSTELWESFEYTSDAQLQLNWINGGDAGAPTRSATFYPMYGSQYAMQVVVGGGGTGYAYRLLPSRNFKEFLNVAIAARSNNAGDTFRLYLYDSLGNYSYWTETLTLADTWYHPDINILGAPTGSSATPVDLEDVVEIRLAELVAGSTYLFDVITFEGLITQDIEDINYGDRVYVDDGGIDSTDYPYGTPTHPTLTVPNAVTIAGVRNLNKIDLRGNLTIDSGVNGYEFIGSAIGGTYITAAAGIINPNCTFNNVEITGPLNGYAHFENNSMLVNVSGLQGVIRNCTMRGTITLESPDFGYTDFYNVASIEGQITLDCTNLVSGDIVTLHEFRGDLQITNLVDTATVIIYSSLGANIYVAVSCTTGTIICHGNCNVVNTSSDADVLVQTLNNEARRTLVYDNFDDDLIGYDWSDAVTGGSTAQTETGGKYRFYNTGVGTAGESYIESSYMFPRNISIEAFIEVVDGEAAGDGERCDAFIEIYQDATHWFKFGPYRDTSEAINSRGYIQYQGGTVDADTTDLDNVARNYKIVIASDMIYFYIDDLQVYGYQWGIIGGYENFRIRLGAATQNNTDVIDVQFDEFKVTTFDKKKDDLRDKLFAIQPTSASLATVQEALDNVLDLSRNASSGYTAMDGTEVDLVTVAAQDTPWEYAGAVIKTHNLQGGDFLTIKAYSVPRAGGADNNPFFTKELQNEQIEDVILPRLYNQYGLTVTAEQTSSHGIDSFQSDDGGVITDETDEANNATANDMALTPGGLVVADDDAVYFGGTHPFGLLRLNVGQAAVKAPGDYDLNWEYYNGTAWVALSNVTDDTTDFTVAGTNDITFTIPTNWATIAINGVTAYYIRAVMSSTSTPIGTAALGTQAWCYLAVLHDEYDERR